MNRESISWFRVVAHAASILVAVPVLAQVPGEVTSPSAKEVSSTEWIETIAESFFRLDSVSSFVVRRR